MKGFDAFVAAIADKAAAALSGHLRPLTAAVTTKLAAALAERLEPMLVTILERHLAQRPIANVEPPLEQGDIADTLRSSGLRLPASQSKVTRVAATRAPEAGR